MAVNPALAIHYLHELAGLELSVDDFDPTFDEVKQTNEDSSKCNNIDYDYSTAAMRQLATCHLEGKGVETNQNMGMAWLQQAYRTGDLDSAFETAVIYEYGKYGVAVDIYLASQWFHGAAQAGHVESMAEYAMCLELGCGVEQSDDGALDWYQKAAELGHVTAHYSVGEWFESARGGLPQSDTEAVLWYFKAASMGDEDSKMALKRLSDIARIVVPGWAAQLATRVLNV